MKTKRIAKNAFVVGFVFVAVALVFTPDNWWSKLLGVLAGISASILSGYLLCDFQETLQKATIAWRKAKRGGHKSFVKLCKFIKWGVGPHPFAHLMILIIALCVFTMLLGFKSINPTIVTVSIILGCFWAAFFHNCMLAFASRHHFYWKRTGRCNLREDWKTTERWNIHEKGFVEMRLTYRNVACLMGFIIWQIAKEVSELFIFVILKVSRFIAWDFWGYAFSLIFFLTRFVLHLFILLHSKERFVWTLGGILGGMFVYLYIAPPGLMGWDRIFLCICGGLTGAGLGIFSSEIVTKRFLKKLLEKNPAWQIK